MHCGPKLIEEVIAHLDLTPEGLSIEGLQNVVWETYRKVSRRAIRYAIVELVKSGRARRDGAHGPVYAIPSKVVGNSGYSSGEEFAEDCGFEVAK